MCHIYQNLPFCKGNIWKKVECPPSPSFSFFLITYNSISFSYYILLGHHYIPNSVFFKRWIFPSYQNCVLLLYTVYVPITSEGCVCSLKTCKRSARANMKKGLMHPLYRDLATIQRHVTLQGDSETNPWIWWKMCPHQGVEQIHQNHCLLCWICLSRCQSQYQFFQNSWIAVT